MEEKNKTLETTVAEIDKDADDDKPTVETTTAEIDKDVIDQLIVENDEIKAVLNDDVACKRMILNAFCEMLSEQKKLHKDLDDLNQTISVIGADKLNEFFKEVRTNYAAEKRRATVKAKVAQSHKKPTKKN